MGSGRNVKFFYFAGEYLRRLIPRRWLMWRRDKILRRLKKRPDFPALKRRIDYYCRFSPTTLPLADSQPIGGSQVFEYCPKVYLLDSGRWRRYFHPALRWRMEPGDNVASFSLPTVVKSRPVGAGNEADVLLKLNRVRHFIFLHDRTPWADKKPQAIFRGRMGRQKRRLEFVKMFRDSPMVDAGCIDFPEGMPPECHREKISLYAHFAYKFIVCLEGNDVASNLKWVMNSNSIAVMPRPRHETWFMEGLLQPDVHYILIRDDFSDLEERLGYYLDHPDEAQRIIEAAHRWTAQFKNPRTEKMVSLAVLHNYFVRTSQLQSVPEI